MKLILAGIEYSGTTTVGEAISKWFTNATGEPYGFHDHFKIPHTGHREFTEDEQQRILDLSPRLKEALQRHQLYYHVQPTFYLDGDISSIGLHIEDAVYGPLYWGIWRRGGAWRPHGGDTGHRGLDTRSCPGDGPSLADGLSRGYRPTDEGEPAQEQPVERGRHTEGAREVSGGIRQVADSPQDLF